MMMQLAEANQAMGPFASDCADTSKNPMKGTFASLMIVDAVLAASIFISLILPSLAAIAVVLLILAVILPVVFPRLQYQ
ncbi:MAG: hypothetical protein PHE47_08400 [Oscillospiraceae bacterium]|nr:hypothetical protein [Oscillospiraceae bacterium]